MIKDENYIVIQGWMINKLNLKGNELIIYAIIFGFTQITGHRFDGSLQYLADWTNSSKQGIQKNINSLVEKGFISKKQKLVNNIKRIEYTIIPLKGIQQSCIEVCNKVVQGIQQSCNNNINIKESKKVSNNININKRKTFNEIIDEKVKNDNVKEKFNLYIKHRLINNEKITNDILNILINKLYKLSDNPDEQIEIIENSILNSYKTFYSNKKIIKSNKKINKKNNFEKREYENLDSLFDNL